MDAEEPGASSKIGAAEPGAPGGTSPGSAAYDPAAQPAMDAVRAAAGPRLGVDAAQVAVERIEARDWNDASLGCPQPDRLYAQVITPGYLVIVSGAGKRLEYHTNTRGAAVLCREL